MPPLFLTPVDPADIERGDGKHFTEFTEKFLRITKDSMGGAAGELIRLRPWQQDLAGRIYARRPDGKLKHRTALVGLPRKSGKSALGSAFALYGLAFGPQGGEVYSIAGTKDQARIIFGVAKDMITREPQFSGLFKVYRDAIEMPSTGSIYRVLAAEAWSAEGLNPTVVIGDEIHVLPDDKLWNVMQLATAARAEPLMIGVTTAGVKTDSSGGDSLCYRLYQHGQKVVAGETTDPSFFMEWHGAAEGADHRDPEIWAAANPGIGDLQSVEDFESAIVRTPEAEFRTKRLNQWVSTAQAWLPGGTWDAIADTERVIPDGAEVCLGFDGSFNNDSTALVVVSCAASGETPHIDVVAAWEKPTESSNDWSVPIVDVEAEIRAACRRWQVREVVCDPYRWARTYQVLEDEGLPIVEFPQSPSRMVPATQRFYEAVMNRAVTHSGDPRLARHVGNAVIRTDSRGSRLSKDAKGSPRKIDLAVSAVMALERAYQEPEQDPTPEFFSWADL